MISGQSITKTEKREGNVEEKYIKIQYELKKQIEFHNSIDIRLIKNVAGVDLAYWNKNGNEYAVCCIIVLNYETQEVVEKKYAVEKVTVPYIPGCLAFRELPVFLKVYKTLDTDVDIFFFDGNGYLHPRHMGVATHAGIIINKPTIGIAKSYLKINNTEFCMPAMKALSYTDIKIDNEIYVIIDSNDDEFFVHKVYSYPVNNSVLIEMGRTKNYIDLSKINNKDHEE